MKKLWTVPLLLTSLITGICMAETYKAPNIEFKKAGPMQSNSVQIGSSWNKGMEYRVLETPIIVREIASEKKEPAKRDPASYSGRKHQTLKFIPGPWYYTK